MTDCTLIADFSQPGAAERWFPVNDTVMGGRSDGGPRFEDGAMVFEGTLRTEDGGFASVRLPMTPGVMAGATSLRVTAIGDGRAYDAAFETDVTAEPGRGGGPASERRVSFGVPIKGLAAGEVATGTADLLATEPTFHGEPVPGAAFDPSAVVELGLFIADGRDGPFRLAVRRIEACR